MARYLLLQILAFSVFVSSHLSAQTLIYDVYRGKSNIGEMIVKRVKSGDAWILSSDAKVKVKFLMSFDLRFQYKAVFRGKNLQSCWLQNSRDGKVTDTCDGKRVGNDFHVDNGEDKWTLENTYIDYTILSTYYTEPLSRTKIFSERWGQFIEAKRIQDHRYSIHLPNGNVNYFDYSNGMCTKVEINHMMGNIRFVLRRS